MENRATVVQKVTAYVNTTFNGDWKKAFDAFADVNGRIGSVALESALKAAGVGYAIGRPFIAAQVMSLMDADGNEYITWDEFQSLAHVTPKS